MKFLFSFLSLLSFYTAVGQGYNIHFHIDNYQNDTLITGYYYADRQLVQDTLIKDNGVFVMKGDEFLKPGMYLAILKPNNNYIQYMLPAGDQVFSIKTDLNQLDKVKFSGSDENDLFYKYIGYIGEKNKEVAKWQEDRVEGEENPEIDRHLEKINDDVIKYQDEIIRKYPASLTAKLIIANRDIEIPEFEGTEEEKNTQRYRYYMEHYFDNLDLGDSTMLRMSFIHPKVTRYVEQLTPQHPDSIIIAIDRILSMTKPAPEIFKFYLSHFLNFYAKSRIVGMDAVYVHLVDNYYSKGEASWIEDETLQKLKENATMLRPTLIGKKSQDITTFKKDGTPVSLHSLDNDFTILYIYAYDCGHCKKSTPHLVDFYNNKKDKDVGIFTICTKRDTTKCWEYTKEKEMEDFINTVDPNNASRFRQKYDVRQTPKVYLLDRNKNILIKNFPLEDVDNIIDEIMKSENEKS